MESPALGLSKNFDSDAPVVGVLRDSGDIGGILGGPDLTLYSLMLY